MNLKRFSDLRNDIVSIIWLFLSLALGLSLYSYNPRDPSWNSLGTQGGPSNWCGYFGSFSSDFLYQFFGISSWVFVIFLFIMSYKVLQNKSEGQKLKKQLWLIFLLVSSASLAEIYFKEVRFHENMVSVGGTIGSFLSLLLTKGLNQYWNRFTIYGLLGKELN